MPRSRSSGLAASTWALTEAGPQGWTNPGVLVSAVIAIAAIAAFVRRMMHTSDPLVPPALFRDRTFTVVNLQTVLLYGALGVSFFLVSYELQVAAGWSALKAGVALLPATGLMLVLSASSGALAQRIGPRLQLTVGPLRGRLPGCCCWPGSARTHRGPPMSCRAPSSSASGSSPSWPR